MQRKQIIEIAGFIALFAIIVTTVLPRQIDKGIIEANQALEEIKQIQQQGASQYLQTKGISDITSKNTSSSLSFDTTNITLSATLLGAKTSIDSYLKPYYAKNPNSIKMGFNISVPLGVAGNNFVNRLQSISFEINSTYPLEAANTGFRYWTGQTKVDQFIVTNDYVVYDFSDILSHFTYKINTTDENNKPITADVPVDYQINIKGNSATISFNMTQIKFLAGQTINLDPSVSISNVATYSPSILNNVTIEEYPLSHITTNDSTLTVYLPFDVNFTDTLNTTYDYANSYNGRANRTFYWVPGVIGNAYKNDGIRNGGSCITINNLGITTSNTVIAWINISSKNTAGQWGYLFDSAGTRRRLIELGQNCGNLANNPTLCIGNNTAHSGGLINLTKNVWYHIVVIWNATDNFTYVYVNGTFINKVNVGFQFIAMPKTSLGCGNLGADNEINGTIDEFMIWNRTLSSDEITLLYASQLGIYATAPRTQDLNNVSIGQDGTIDSINVTTNTTQLNGTSMQLQLWYYNSTGANTANSSWQSVTTGNNQVTTFTSVPTTTYNVSLNFNFSSNAFAGYSPIISDSINITSWTQGGADTTFPTYSSIGVNNTNPQILDYINFSVLWNDNVALDKFIFSWNASGLSCNTWANDSSTSFIGGWSNISKQIPATCLLTNVPSIAWRVFGNDTSGNMNVTPATLSFSLFNSCTPPSTITNDWLVTCSDNCNVTGVNTIVHSLNITGTSGYFNVIDGANLTINGNLYNNGCPINVQLINGKSSKIYVNASYR